MSTTKQMLVTYAQYHLWAYEKLYTIVDTLSEADYKKDCGLFFKSIHGTLNHLLLVDKLWFTRCHNGHLTISGLDQELLTQRDTLKIALFDQAKQWIEFIEGFTETKLDEHFHYINTQEIAKEAPYATTFHHVFNHGTHHRGQISAGLTIQGFTAPAMDFIYFYQE